MKLGITGSRKYPNKAQVEDTILNIPLDWVLVSGACLDSPDVWAIAVAETRNIKYIEYPAQWRVNGILNKRAGFERNTIIVQESDIILAFWDEKSRGCLDTIMKAIAANKPLMIITPTDIAPTYNEILDRLLNND